MRRKMILLTMLISSLCIPAAVQAAGQETADETAFTTSVSYNAETPDEDYPFAEVLERNGILYRLQTVTTAVTGETPVKNTNTTQEIVRSEPIPNDTVYEPEQTIVRNGKTYQLIRTEMEESDITGQAQEARGEISYPNQVRKPDVPTTAEFDIKDINTGLTKKVKLPLKEVIESSRSWKDDFTATLTVYPTDTARYYKIGDTVLELKEDSPGLEGQEAAILNVLGLSGDYYQIKNTVWAGDSYLDTDGIQKRDVAVTGSRYVATYTARYSGTVIPDSIPAHTFVSTYENTEETIVSTTYHLTSTATYVAEEKEPEPSFFEQYMPIIVSVALFVVLIFVLLLLFYLAKKKKSERNKNRGGKKV